MHEIRLCLLGFGNVGQALAQLLIEKQAHIQEQLSVAFRVVAIKTARHGTCFNPAGIPLERAIAAAARGESLSTLSKDTAPDNLTTLLKRSRTQMLAENTPVNYTDGQPALDHIRLALRMGMDVVTANKGPVVHGYHELVELAHAQNCQFLFESTVMDGAPIFALWREALPAAELQAFRGVLNSTTNLIFTRMETGESFDEAVRYAQKIGIAETDPSGDIDGWDAAIKVSAMVTVLMGIPLTPQEVDRQGIRELRRSQVESELKKARRWKLICHAERKGDHVSASVRPEPLDSSDPLYSVMGTSSAVTFESDVLGALTLREEDPGPHTTAYGLLADMLNIVRTTS